MTPEDMLPWFPYGFVGWLTGLILFLAILSIIVREALELRAPQIYQDVEFFAACLASIIMLVGVLLT